MLSCFVDLSADGQCVPYEGSVCAASDSDGQERRGGATARRNVYLPISVPDALAATNAAVQGLLAALGAVGPVTPGADGPLGPGADGPGADGTAASGSETVGPYAQGGQKARACLDAARRLLCAHAFPECVGGGGGFFQRPRPVCK